MGRLLKSRKISRCTDQLFFTKNDFSKEICLLTPCQSYKHKILNVTIHSIESEYIHFLKNHSERIILEFIGIMISLAENSYQSSLILWAFSKGQILTKTKKWSLSRNTCSDSTISGLQFLENVLTMDLMHITSAQIVLFMTSVGIKGK